MPESSRFTGSSTGIQLDFVEREATPRELMRLSIQLHLSGLSLSDTVSVLERFGVERARSTIHNWVQKADLQPTADKQPDHVALDETVIQLDAQRYWLYAAIDPETNEFLHVKLYSTRTTALTEMFLRELRERETRHRRCRVSRRFSNMAQSGTPQSQPPISLRKTRKSERCRTSLSRDKTTHLPVWKLLQKRRSGNCRNMVAELRILLESANLNNASVGTERIPNRPSEAACPPTKRGNIRKGSR